MKGNISEIRCSRCEFMQFYEPSRRRSLMRKTNRPVKNPNKQKLSSGKRRKLSVEFHNHHDLLLKLGDAISSVGTHLGTTTAAGRQGTAVAATQKAFIGYDEALKIVLECSGRTGPEDPVIDPQAPPATKDQIVQCILKNLHDEGFSLSSPLSIGDTETCDALAAEAQYASN
jgi:hypothetical protein